MVHAFLITLFAFTALKYLSWELSKKTDYKKHLWFLVAAVSCTFFAYLLTAYYKDRAGNFLYHAIGGGVASSFLYRYLLKQFKCKLNWRLELITLFAFTCSLGVLNELAEYALELMHFATLSFDTHDTWRDLAANSFGALTGWLIYRLAVHFAKSTQK